MNKETVLNTDNKHLEEKIAILEKKFEEKSREVDRLKERFLSNISHEIRTPMNAIVGFSSLLGDTELDEAEKKVFIDGILKSSDDLMKIIDNLIQSARLEAKEIEVQWQQVDVNAILEEILKKFQLEKNIAGKSHIDLRLMNDINHKQLTIKTDPVKLQHILCNLLENALKFTEEGFIELGYKHKSQKNIEFFVKDSGIGIPRKKLSMVFNKFTQLDDSPRKSYKGIGIGLSISKSLTEILGGKMNVSSTPGNGSTFSFTLPLTLTQKENIHDFMFNRSSNTWPGHSKRSFNEAVTYWKRNISVHSKYLNFF
ncbi:MAG: HAMP domain-containing sensor histidine kinase [Bacteroidota bacterium]|nr:HAMP domain-containing sensor histidine kinase [Bacteroidota bacterium]